MKTITKSQLYKLPSGAVYSRVSGSGDATCMEVMRSVIHDDDGDPIDWFYCDLIIDENCRDGFFDDEELFLLWEQEDKARLIKALSKV